MTHIALLIVLALGISLPAEAAPTRNGWRSNLVRNDRLVAKLNRGGKARIKPRFKKRTLNKGKRLSLRSFKIPSSKQVKISRSAQRDAGALQKALDRFFVDKKTVHRILEKSKPEHLAAVRQAFNQKYGKQWKGGSLRGALNKKFWDGGARRVLGALEKGLSRFKVLNSKGKEGRLHFNIDKVFALNRQRDTNGGKISESDLVTRHGLTGNNKIKLLVDGHQAFKSIFSAMSRATQTLHVSYYIFNDDKLGKAFAGMLMKKARQGVEVRLMVDGIGSVQMLGSPKRKLLNKMQKAGVEVIRNHIINPMNKSKKMNHPDHRKLVIVDGKVGFTGGMNVGTHYISQYHDLMVKVEGPAVNQLQTEYLTGWMLLGGRVDKKIKSEKVLRRRLFPKPNKVAGNQKIQTVQHIPGENRDILKTYLKQIKRARRSIHIENPYMTSHKIQNALIDAAKRGVDVHVVLPGQNDHAFSHWAARAKYPKMLDAGVKLYEYPGFNHGKVMVTDGRFTTIGSSNLDDIALYHIYETNVNVHDKRFAADVMKRVFKKDIAMSKPMKKSEITTTQKVMGRFWNLFAHFI